jgi:DNA repair exonuclease SbcCD ATPase subunit
MSEKKSAIEIIENSLKSVEDNFKQFIEVLETAKTELLVLEKDKEQLNKTKELLEGEKLQLEQATKTLEADKSQLELEKANLESEKKKLEEETQKLEQEKQDRDQKIGSLTEEQERLLKEYASLKVELKKFAKIAEESQDTEFDFGRIKALLSITMLLIEEIWSGQPHYRILLTLHGDKEKMSREQIKNTTGIAGAMVLRAVHELAKIGVLEYDEDTAMVTLKKRLFSKKSLEEKKPGN